MFASSPFQVWPLVQKRKIIRWKSSGWFNVQNFADSVKVKPLQSKTETCVTIISAKHFRLAKQVCSSKIL